MKSAIIPFEKDHARAVLSNVRGDNANVIELFGADVETLLDRHVIAGPARTLDTDAHGPVACLGLSFLWTGVAEVWAITADVVSGSPHLRYLLMRFCVEQLLTLWDEYDLHRVQASVCVHDTASIAWCNRLGFDYEGTMAGYGPDGSTHLRFGLLRENIRRLQHGLLCRHRGHGAVVHRAG